MVYKNKQNTNKQTNKNTGHIWKEKFDKIYKWAIKDEKMIVSNCSMRCDGIYLPMGVLQDHYVALVMMRSCRSAHKHTGSL